MANNNRLSFTRYSKDELKKFQEEKLIVKQHYAFLKQKGSFRNDAVNILLTDKNLVITKTIHLLYLGL